ncbi:uncharacterized protein BDZ99DRAFT_469621 [Mytilinidion resinicola]|uniref:Uncharacterized protein n=1 Tax=Mytilinidion resinicola TaxID=574789 RepID=A0A6A6XXY7_9PEZI|nr:uncharacterized protein BDZ99DRAFT_469621 [Mytilinidion resinicola]KAF2801416.1 hypothetical protein BDZ99DRAFT_469621 [Mytilinidion resinicola]
MHFATASSSPTTLISVAHTEPIPSATSLFLIAAAASSTGGGLEKIHLEAALKMSKSMDRAAHMCVVTSAIKGP